MTQNTKATEEIEPRGSICEDKTTLSRGRERKRKEKEGKGRKGSRVAPISLFLQVGILIVRRDAGSLRGQVCVEKRKEEQRNARTVLPVLAASCVTENCVLSASERE
jgi:hypothetical protein